MVMKKFRGVFAAVLLMAACLIRLEGAGPDDPPMNIEFAAADTNGFPINPVWTFQRTHASDDPPFPKPLDLCGQFAVTDSNDPSHPSMGSPPCTTQDYSVDYPYGGHDFICVNFGGNQGSLHGHVDWRPVQYSGTLFFGDVRPWYRLGDGDYNFALVPDNRAGLTVDNYRAVPGGRAALGIEFDSAEVNHRIGSAWWTQFRKANNNTRHAMIDGDRGQGSRAIVWGLLGVDTEHYAHSELHPVYALAIEDPKSTSENDMWRVLVRNWGNEGFCSQFTHDVDSTTIKLLIPRLGARTVSVTSSEVTSNPKGLSWSFAPVKDGVLLTFEPGNAGAKPFFDGELHLKWTAEIPGANLMASTTTSSITTDKLQFELRIPVPEPGEDKVAEDAVEKFWNSLTPEQKQEAQDKLQVTEESTAGKARQVSPKGLQQSPQNRFQFLLRPSEALATSRPTLDKEKVKRDLLRSSLICDFEQSKGDWPLIREDQCEVVRRLSQK